MQSERVHVVGLSGVWTLMEKGSDPVDLADAVGKLLRRAWSLVNGGELAEILQRDLMLQDRHYCPLSL